MTTEDINNILHLVDVSFYAGLGLGISAALVGIGVWQLVQAMRNFKPHHGETP
jgi:hypothetical protein